MLWLLKHGNLLAESADALVVSANPFLNLSGGVGGALLNKYGQAIQTELHYHLKKIGQRYVQPMEVVPTFGGDVPHKVILHAVAIDAFYDSSPEWVTASFVKALELAAKYEARTVACAALATGYGRMPMSDFAAGLKPVLVRAFSPLEQATLCILGAEKLEQLRALLPELERCDHAPSAGEPEA